MCGDRVASACLQMACENRSKKKKEKKESKGSSHAS